MISQKLSIRKAKRLDVSKILALIIELAEDQKQVAYVATNEVAIKNAAFGPVPQMWILVAEIDNDIIGYLSYVWTYSIWSAQKYMALDDLYVTQKYRGLKIGEKLMTKAKSICQEEGVMTIKWEVETVNTKAIQFYERLGAGMRTKGIFKWDLQE